MSFTAVFTSSDSQTRWIEHMKHNYTTNHDIRPCVFQVPDNLKETKPEGYTPQLLGLGPYHHFRPQVQHMEREKRAGVIDALKKIELQDFVDVAKKCASEFEPIIRSCYDRYLDLGKETLAWVVIVDGLYLWYLMGDYTYGKEQVRNEALYAELFMLESQIPIVLIQNSFDFIGLHLGIIQNLNEGNYKERLLNLYHEFCKLISPLKISSRDGAESNIDWDKVKNKHLLHYMYLMIVKTKNENNNNNNVDVDDRDWIRRFARERCRIEESSLESVALSEGDEVLDKLLYLRCAREGMSERDRPQPSARAAVFKCCDMGYWAREFARKAASKGREIGDGVREAASQGREIIMEAIEVFNSSLSDAKSAGIKIPGNVDTVSNLLRNIQKVLDLHVKKHDNQTDIPSASRLKAILKVTFTPCCGIEGIILKGKILHLPVMTLRPSSEVILRNLAAYEQIAKMGSTQIREYLEFMGGLVKSEKDVKLLRDAGIIEGEQLSDKEIVRMCNGFEKSDKNPDEESSNNIVQKTVKEVKDEFGNVGIVKACRSTMKGFAGCVKFFKPLFPLVVLMFLVFQSFCDIYGCRRMGSPYGGAQMPNLYLRELDPNAQLMLPRKLYRY